MKKIILFLWPVASLAGQQLPPTPFPVFLKAGFSSVLEFAEAPMRVVLGDGQSFQVEKVDRSVVLRTLTPYAASNMFVYFRNSQPRLFILTASEDANPTYYKKFDKEIAVKEVLQTQVVWRPSVAIRESKLGNGIRIHRCTFDQKKDYLTVEGEIESQSKELLKPNWNLIRLTFNSSALTPFKLWSERETIQKDSRVKFRAIFAKPNLPRNLIGVSLVVPLLGKQDAIAVSLRPGRAQ